MLLKDIFQMVAAIIVMCVLVSLLFICHFNECFKNVSNLSVICEDILIAISATS